MVCGADSGSPVWDKSKPPFKFSGTLHGVTVDVSGDLIKDADAEVRMVLARRSIVSFRSHFVNTVDDPSR